jgi:hypothetical protein
METEVVTKKSWKLVIIANPIYDTVFKRLMENHRRHFFKSVRRASEKNCRNRTSFSE